MRAKAVRTLVVGGRAGWGLRTCRVYVCEWAGIRFVVGVGVPGLVSIYV